MKKAKFRTLLFFNNLVSDIRLVGILSFFTGINMLLGAESAVPLYLEANYPALFRPLADLLIIAGVTMFIKGKIEDAGQVFIFTIPFIVYSLLSFQWALTAFEKPSFGSIISFCLLKVYKKVDGNSGD